MEKFCERCAYSADCSACCGRPTAKTKATLEQRVAKELLGIIPPGIKRAQDIVISVYFGENEAKIRLGGAERDFRDAAEEI